MTSKTLDRIIAAIFVLMLVIGLTGLGSGMGLAYYIAAGRRPRRMSRRTFPMKRRMRRRLRARTTRSTRRTERRRTRNS